MEDRHVVAALDPSQGVQQAHGAVGLQDKVSVAAVFDGHAGYATAAYAAQHIPQLLHEALSGRPGSKAEGEQLVHEVSPILLLMLDTSCANVSNVHATLLPLHASCRRR